MIKLDSVTFSYEYGDETFTVHIRAAASKAISFRSISQLRETFSPLRSILPKRSP